jgi:hypothetical protein
MRRIGKWAAAVATVLVSAISAGTAFAAGAPPPGGFSGGAEGGKGIDHSLLLHRDSADWTLAIVMVAGLLAVAVILALSRQTRERNARSAGAVTPTVTS